MKCPLCKDKELLPARIREDRKEADALKCVYCAAMFQMDETNHLRRLVPPPVSVAPAMTHTAALAASGLNPKDHREAKPAAPRSVKSKIDDHDKSEIFKRLVMGEKCVSIAAAVGCKLQVVNNYKFYHKAAIAAAQKAIRNPGIEVDEKAGTPKKVVHSEPKCNASFCNSKMNGYCTTPNECGFKVKPEMPLREKEQIELLDLMCKGNIEGLEPDEVTKLISLWYRWYKEQQQARDTEVRQEIVKECTKVQPDIDVPPNFKPGTDEFFVYCQGANDYWLSIQAHIENKAREATNV